MTYYPACTLTVRKFLCVSPHEKEIVRCVKLCWQTPLAEPQRTVPKRSISLDTVEICRITISDLIASSQFTMIRTTDTRHVRVRVRIRHAAESTILLIYLNIISYLFVSI